MPRPRYMWFDKFLLCFRSISAGPLRGQCVRADRSGDGCQLPPLHHPRRRHQWLLLLPSGCLLALGEAVSRTRLLSPSAAACGSSVGLRDVPNALLCRNKQESAANLCPALVVSSQLQPAEQRHPEKPCSPPNQSQQFPHSPLIPSARSGLPPQLHPHLHGPPEPPGCSSPPFSSPFAVAQWSTWWLGAPGTSPWLSGSVLSLPSKGERETAAELSPTAAPGCCRTVQRERGKGDGWCLGGGGEGLYPSHRSPFGDALCTPTLCPLCCLQATVLSAATCKHAARASRRLRDTGQPRGCENAGDVPEFPWEEPGWLRLSPKCGVCCPPRERPGEEKGCPKQGQANYGAER